MSFFTTASGEQIQAATTFESGGGNMAPIPDGTSVVAMIDEAKWDIYQAVGYISLRWVVAAPEAYKNRKVFQKVQVEHSSPEKREKALRMLAAIDANCGGKLMAAGVTPTDASLAAALLSRPMVLKMAVWTIKEDKQGAKLPEADWKSGNWVSKVAPRTPSASAAVGQATSAPQHPVPPPPALVQRPAPIVADPFGIDDDMIPF